MNDGRWFSTDLLWQCNSCSPTASLQVQGSVCQSHGPKWSCCRKGHQGMFPERPPQLSTASPALSPSLGKGEPCSVQLCYSCKVWIHSCSGGAIEVSWKILLNPQFAPANFWFCSPSAFPPTFVCMLSHCSYFSILAMAQGQNWGLLLPLCSMLYKYILYKHQLG